MNNSSFYTFNEYMKQGESRITPSMEDYTEMIYRLSGGNGFTRINELSRALNVQPPSASKMVQRLASQKILKYEKYGFIILTDKGHRLGDALMKRHGVLENFLRLIGVDAKDLLRETEKIEHTVSPQTTLCIERLVHFFNENREIRGCFLEYISPKGCSAAKHGKKGNSCKETQPPT